MLYRNKVKSAVLGSAMAVGLCATVPARANLIVNGDFETGSLSDWTAANNVTTTDTPFFGFSDPGYGSYFAVFNPGQSDPDGVISQTISTVVGINYTLVFNYGSNGSEQSIAASVLDDLGGLVAGSYFSSSSPELQSFTLNFTATSSSTTISFTDYVYNDTFNTDGGLDNVSATEVPEPASLAVLGFGVAGVVTARRRRRNAG